MTPSKRRAGIALNLAIRLSILYFLIEVLLVPNDPRFVGKAIPIRNLIIVILAGLLFPTLYLWRHVWRRYPFQADNLFLSIFWLDMAGNSFNLYNTYYYFDLIPHFHGTGAAAAVLLGSSRLSPVSSVGTANVLHMILEIQEYYTDVVFGTHNIRGVSDVVNDLAVGLLASAIYTGVHALKAKAD